MCYALLIQLTRQGTCVSSHLAGLFSIPCCLNSAWWPILHPHHAAHGFPAGPEWTCQERPLPHPQPASPLRRVPPRLCAPCRALHAPPLIIPDGPNRQPVVPAACRKHAGHHLQHAGTLRPCRKPPPPQLRPCRTPPRSRRPQQQQPAASQAAASAACAWWRRQQPGQPAAAAQAWLCAWLADRCPSRHATAAAAAVSARDESPRSTTAAAEGSVWAGAGQQQFTTAAGPGPAQRQPATSAARPAGTCLAGCRQPRVWRL